MVFELDNLIYSNYDVLYDKFPMLIFPQEIKIHKNMSKH